MEQVHSPSPKPSLTPVARRMVEMAEKSLAVKNGEIIEVVTEPGEVKSDESLPRYATTYSHETRANRETAVARLAQMIKTRERELAGLQALQKVMDRVEPGSPLEETIWELLCQWG